MTLNITIVNPWGIWQCSDLRLTTVPDQKVVDDYSIKHVSVRATDGAALITYTGLGKVGQDSVADWLRRTIRGESRTVDETLHLIREAATKKLGLQSVRAGVPHTFNIGAFARGQPWAVVITNLQNTPDYAQLPPVREFGFSGAWISDAPETIGQNALRPMAMVTGARGAVSPDDMTLLDRIAARKPKHPIDYRRLLAGINRRASKQRPFGKLISEACVTAYIPPTGKPFQQETHWWGLTRPSVERSIPITLFGVDITEILKVQAEHFQALDDSDPNTREEAKKRFSRLFEEAARRAVKPDI